MEHSNNIYDNTNHMLQNTLALQWVCNNHACAVDTIIHNRVHKSLETLWPITHNNNFRVNSQFNNRDQTRERNFELDDDEDLTMFDTSLNMKNVLKHARSM